MAKLRSKLFLAGLAVLLVPLLILICEGGVRLFMRHLDPLEVFVNSPQLRADTQGETTSGLFEFDPALTWKVKPNLRNVWWDFTTVSTNAAGLRLDREVGPKRGLRIVCLGDSVTFGYRVPVVPDRAKPAAYDATELAYPKLLETQLRAKFPGREIEVLPLACPGYTSGQGLAWLQRDLASLQPDVVTACFGWNDVRAAGLPDRLTMARGSQVAGRRLMSHSQLLLLIAQNAQTTQQKRTSLTPPPPEPRSSVEEYVSHFAEMANLCRQQGATFAVILPVYRDPNQPGDYPEAPGHPGDVAEGQRMTSYRQALLKSNQTAKVPALEIPEFTESAWPGNAAYFGERIHPNAAGHRLLAERLVDFLSPLLPAK